MIINEFLIFIFKFIVGYLVYLMGVGVYIFCVICNLKCIGEVYGVDVKLSVFYKNIILIIIDNEMCEVCNEVIDIFFYLISFEYNLELSVLSWEVYDKYLFLYELLDKFNKIILVLKIDLLFVFLLVGFVNVLFCKLFGGDIIFMGIVFLVIIIGFFLK